MITTLTYNCQACNMLYGRSYGSCSIVTRVRRATYRQQLAPFVTGNIIPNKGLLAQHIRVGHYIIFGDEITET